MKVLSSRSFASLDMAALRAPWGKAEIYGAIAIVMLALPAGAALFLPFSKVPDVAQVSSSPAAPDQTESAFIDKAPFDPQHRRETSIGLLQQQAGVVTAPPDPLIISGILIDGSERKVMFSSRPDEWIQEGTEIDGWLVRHIEPESVILTQGADIKNLTYAASLESLSARQP
jgi:hypothetical protein